MYAFVKTDVRFSIGALYKAELKNQQRLPSRFADCFLLFLLVVPVEWQLSLVQLITINHLSIEITLRVTRSQLTYDTLYWIRSTIE